MNGKKNTEREGMKTEREREKLRKNDQRNSKVG